MATFRPKNNTCIFNFDDKFTYTLALNDNTLQRIIEVCEAQLNALEPLKDKVSKETIDKAYNISLDALDDIFGDGAGADIMSIFENPGMAEIAQIIEYISDEYTEQYKAVFQTNNKPAQTINLNKRGRR